MKNIILVLPLFELPARGGPQISARNLLNALSASSNVHVFIMVSKNKFDSYTVKYLKKRCKSVKWSFSSIIGSIGFLKKLAIFKIIITFMDVVQLLLYAYRKKTKTIWFDRAEEIIPYFIYLVKGFWPTCVAICDTCAVYSEFIARELEFADEKRKVSIQEAARIKEHQEIILVNLCEVVTAVSERDAKYYRSLALNPQKVHLVSNVVDMDFFIEKKSSPVDYNEQTIIFTGTFYSQNSPMVKGARWFIENVWVDVIKINSNARVFFVGKGADKNILDLSTQKGVFVVGEVFDIVPYLQHAKIGIVPLFWESGTRFKILEYGACSLAVVSTQLGAEGLDLKSGENIIIIDEAKQFANNINLLLRDKNIRDYLGSNLNDTVCKNYSLNRLIKEVKKVLDDLDG